MNDGPREILRLVIALRSEGFRESSQLGFPMIRDTNFLDGRKSDVRNCKKNLFRTDNYLGPGFKNLVTMHCYLIKIMPFHWFR